MGVFRPKWMSCVYEEIEVALGNSRALNDALAILSGLFPGCPNPTFDQEATDALLALEADESVLGLAISPTKRPVEFSPEAIVSSSKLVLLRQGTSKTFTTAGAYLRSMKAKGILLAVHSLEGGQTEIYLPTISKNHSRSLAAAIGLSSTQAASGSVSVPPMELVMHEDPDVESTARSEDVYHHESLELSADAIEGVYLESQAQEILNDQLQEAEDFVPRGEQDFALNSEDNRFIGDGRAELKTLAGAESKQQRKRDLGKLKRSMVQRLREIQAVAKRDGLASTLRGASVLFPDAATALIEAKISPDRISRIFFGGTLRQSLWVLSDEYLLEVRKLGRSVKIQLAERQRLTLPVIDPGNVFTNMYLFGARGQTYELGVNANREEAQAVQRLVANWVLSGRPVGRALLSALPIVEVQRATGLSGVFKGESMYLDLYEDRVVIGSDNGQDTVLNIADIRSIRVAGPRDEGGGGGWIGGGFGVEGAAIGIAASAMLNALASDTTKRALIELTSLDAEFVGIIQGYDAETIESAMTPMYVHLRRLLEHKPSTEGPSEDRMNHEGAPEIASVIEDLERISSLRQTGHLSEAEFERLKREILGRA